MAFKITRSQAENKLFGVPRNLPLNQLPTKKDVFLYYELLRLQNTIPGEIPPITSELARLTSFDLISIWARATVPTMSEKKVIEMIVKLQTSVQSIQKTPLIKSTQFTGI